MIDTNVTSAQKKRGNQFVEIAAQARLAHYRREARETAARLRRTERDCSTRSANEASPLMLIAHWEGDIETLRDLVEMSSDWGPFEMTSVTRIRDDRGGLTRRLLCHFEYHGAEAVRGHHEEVLRSVLARVTRWEDPAETVAPVASSCA